MESTASHLVFTRSGLTFAVPVARIFQIVEVPKVTRVAGVPPFLLGVVQHHGEILPVVDADAFLGVAKGAGLRVRSGSGFVAGSPGGRFIVEIDATTGLTQIAVEDAGPRAAETNDLLSTALVSGRAVSVIDLDALERRMERELSLAMGHGAPREIETPLRNARLATE